MKNPSMKNFSFQEVCTDKKTKRESTIYLHVQ